MAEPVRVLLTCYNLEAGGTERQLTELAKAMDRTKYAPQVGCFRREGLRVAELEAAGVPVVEFPIRSLSSLSTLGVARRFQLYCRNQRIGMLHAFDVPTGAILAPLARWAGVPVVLASQRAYRSMFPPLYQRLIRLSDRVVDGTVVNCEALRRHLIEDEGVRPERVQVCYNGLDPERFSPADRNVNATPMVGTVSVLRPEKGIDVLIEAAAQAGIALRIVGGGSERGRLETQARNLGVNTEFLPSVREVEQYYRQLDIFVLPSRTEALSNSLMEAMACGCCVIASRVGGSPELVRHGESGLLFTPGDAGDLAVQLRRALANADERLQFGTTAAGFIRSQFTITAAAARMAEIYGNFTRI